MGDSPVPYEALFEHSLSAYAVHTIILDETGKPVDYVFDAVNKAFETITGLRAEHILGKRISEVLPHSEEGWVERYAQVAMTGVPETFESYSGALGKWYQVTAFRHKPLGFAVSFLDITAQKIEGIKAEMEKAKYQTLFDLPNAVKLVIDPSDGTILEANPKAAEFYGWTQDELKTMKVSQLNTLAPDEILQEMALARSLQRDHFHFRHRLKNGEIRNVEVFSSPAPWDDREVLFSIVHDVTEADRSQQATLHRERLSTIGEMTACLSHEIGNLLGILFGQVQLLTLEIPPGPAKEKLENTIRTQLRKTQELIESVKRYSRNQDPEKRVVALGQLVREVVALEAPFCRQTGVRLSFHNGTGHEDWVEVDPALVQQVFVNLIKNSVQALEGYPSPEITVVEMRDGDQALLVFSDNGPGIAPEIRERLFTPFFTTKTWGSEPGTGLGLSFARTIIREQGGSIILGEGPGAIFEIRFPFAGAPGI